MLYSRRRVLVPIGDLPAPWSGMLAASQKKEKKKK
jgi:hypothetical protein